MRTFQEAALLAARIDGAESEPSSYAAGRACSFVALVLLEDSVFLRSVSGFIIPEVLVRACVNRPFLLAAASIRKRSYR